MDEKTRLGLDQYLYQKGGTQCVNLRGRRRGLNKVKSILMGLL